MCPAGMQTVMIDPVIAADGHTYERRAIEQGLLRTNMSPVTGTALLHVCLVPNIAIKQAIAAQLGH